MGNVEIVFPIDGLEADTNIAASDDADPKDVLSRTVQVSPLFLSPTGSAVVVYLRVTGVKGETLRRYVLRQHGATGKLILTEQRSAVRPAYLDAAEDEAVEKEEKEG